MVGALESAGWTVMDRLPNCVEFWKHHPGGPPSPRVLVYVDGTMRGDRNDVAEAKDDIKRIRANPAAHREPAKEQA